MVGRAVDSRCSSTCCWGDCRTYTIANRCRWPAVIFSERSPLTCGSCRLVAGLTPAEMAGGGSRRVGLLKGSGAARRAYDQFELVGRVHRTVADLASPEGVQDKTSGAAHANR